MAQTDTGLGWNAKDIWLHSQAGIGVANFSTIGGPSFPNQPLPKNITTRADCESRGFPFAVRIKSGSSTSYMGTWNDYDVVLFCIRTSIRIEFVAVATSPEARCVKVEDGNWYDNGGAGYPINVYHADSGLYYTEMASFRIEYFDSLNVPEYSSLAEGMAAVQVITKTYYKLNSGYAVCAIPSFYYTDGTLYTTPALISTDRDAVILSLDGITPDVAEQLIVSALVDGRTFYMGYVLNSDLPNAAGGAGQVANLAQFAASLPSKVLKILATETYANIQVTDATDPYGDETEPSGEDGGDGEDQDDDPVEEETLPLPSVAGHGFCTIYVPSSQELGQMASYLWSGAFDVDQIIKLFSNPMDSILGLSAVPVSLSGTSEQIYLGGVALSNITMPKYTGRTSVKVDFGTATIEERWGSYLDYDPYTEFSIYLPFIGIKPLKADDIMGKTISLMYSIDILSGGCVAYIRPSGGSVLYEWSGQCALQIPVTSRNYDNVFQTAMSVVGAVGAAVVAPASAPVLSGAVASAAVQAAATKPRIERSGSVNGITGFLGQLRPYIIRTIPEAFIPADQNKFIGYPAYINVDLSSVTGYNEVDSIHLENVTATGAELDEIESILKGGVIF